MPKQRDHLACHVTTEIAAAIEAAITRRSKADQMMRFFPIRQDKKLPAYFIASCRQAAITAMDAVFPGVGLNLDVNLKH